ncbi:MAG: cytochrome P450 [Oscillatoriales cyanobacterium RM1_1_9]|nr:cytochrome P450 [Oscillatoriales cyanobacterium RM1_1_9]
MTQRTIARIRGPKATALVQRLQWVADPLQYMDTWGKQHPDIFATQVTGNTMIFVNHPQILQELLTRDTRDFEAPGRVNQILQPLLGEQSLILLEGDRHRQQRKLLMPPFHGDRMRNYGELICDVTQKVTSRWHENEVFVARDAMQEVSLMVILQAVFGIYSGERYDLLKRSIASMLSVTNSPLSSSLLFFSFLQQDLGSWSPWGRFLRQRQQIDQLLFTEIAERRQHPDEDRTDILSLMMAARDEQGQPMRDEELRDELLTLLFAGHETTATALAWTLYWVHRQPEVYGTLMQELDSLGPDADPMAIFRLPYLTAVCQETLRIYPVGMLTFPRVAKRVTELAGYRVTTGDTLVGCIYLTHRRPDLYPEPRRFKPERFMERKFSPYEYLPFGAGARQCIGMALAQYEMKLALATILMNYQLALAEKHPVKAARRGVTLSPLGGVRMK